MFKLQEKPSDLKREQPPLPNMTFLNFFLSLWVIFALLDPDPDSKFGSTDLIESGSGSETQRVYSHRKNRFLKSSTEDDWRM